VTQALAGTLAMGLWVLMLTGAVRVWMVFGLSGALGLVTVFDQPAQQAFVEEMVGRDRVANAVALNSAVMNSARITGPAIAGLLVAWLGLAWVFALNALTYVAVVTALAAMRRAELVAMPRHQTRPPIREGLVHAWSIAEIRVTIVLVACVGTLVYNFPTFLTLMASDSFHGGANLAGYLMAVLGVGTVAGALAAAHRSHPTAPTVVVSAVLLGAAMVGTAALPTEAAVIVALLPVGALAIFFGSTANAHMQVRSAPEFRGRVMGIYSLLTLGVTVIGGPFVGWVCQRWSPRVGFGMAGAVTGLLAVACALAPMRRKRLRQYALRGI
jgi:predicted MFS family arabinose efflux permease